MQTIQIFLGSSSELSKERDEFRRQVSKENDLPGEDKKYLNIVQWETYSDAISHQGKQQEYNDAILGCDYAVFMFYRKLGQYTREEFDTALAQFKSKGSPLIYTYFKGTREALKEAAEENPEEAAELLEFRASMLEGELKHYCTSFNSVAELSLHFFQQLRKTEPLRPVYIFNGKLVHLLMTSVRPCSAAAARLLTWLEGIPDWEQTNAYVSKAGEFLSYSFAGVLGIQLSKLMAIGLEEDSSKKEEKYIAKCCEIASYAASILIFSLVSRLWDEQRQSKRDFSLAEHKALDDFFNGPLEMTLDKKLELLRVLDGIFENPAYNLHAPLPEWSSFRSSLQAGTTFQEACRVLTELQKSKLFKHADCERAETSLAGFMEPLAFFVQYNMASIRRIGYWQPRNSRAEYLHRFTSLGLDSKAQKDTEKANLSSTTVQTDAVLLYRGPEYNDHISLSPFIIDYNALTFEHGAKICFFQSRELLDDSAVYVFHEDKSIVRLEPKEGLQKTSEVMLDEKKQAEIKIQITLDLLNEARSCLLNP